MSASEMENQPHNTTKAMSPTSEIDTGWAPYLRLKRLIDEECSELNRDEQFDLLDLVGEYVEELEDDLDDELEQRY